MLEKLIENWLDNASERSFQSPFCSLLSHEGHRILHSTRHSAMELGIDVYTIQKNGVPAAFQLKAGKIGLSEWRDISKQVTDLCYGVRKHPSVSSAKPHSPYLVTTGQIEEEVVTQINNLNRELRQFQKRELITIQRGDLLHKMKELNLSLWPSELNDIQNMLALISKDGKEPIKRDEYFQLFESTQGDLINVKRRPSKQSCARAFTANALVCSIASQNLYKENNHIAIIESWIIYIISVLHLATKWNLQLPQYQSAVELAKQSIWKALDDLIVELKTSRTLLQAGFVDPIFMDYRITTILGYLSIYALSEKTRNEDILYIKEWIMRYLPKMKLWGESAIPLFLATFWFHRRTDARLMPEIRLISMFESLVNLIGSKQKHPAPFPMFASSYYTYQDLLPFLLDAQLDVMVRHPYRIAKEPFRDEWQWRSQFLEPTFLMLIKRLWKQRLKAVWANYTRIKVEQFELADHSDFFVYRTTHGKVRVKVQPRRQQWRDLVARSNAVDDKAIPQLLQTDPLLLLLILFILPFRATTDTVLWLDNELSR